MEALQTPAERRQRPIPITLACLFGFAGLPVAAYLLIVNRAAVLAYNGPSFFIAAAFFGSLGLAGLAGYWMMRRWGVYAYSAMTVLTILYAAISGSFSLSSSLSSVAIAAIGWAYFTQMQ